MTFAEYNTDENFNKPSNAMELVKLGKEEGKTRDEIVNSLSPLWKEDKKGNVKKALDYHFNTETAPKSEEKETVEETVKTETSNLSANEKSYNDAQNKRADEAKKEMLDEIKKDSAYNWEERYNSSIKRADAYKTIDDHFIEGLPTFMFRRYENGEFGEKGSKDAKLRMAYFMINGLGTALQNASAAIKGGQMKQSDYEKFKDSQMVNALQNRWEKNKADTEGAIKSVEKEFGNEQDARLAAEQFTRDRRANTKWNMMDQNQKIYALEVTKEIGDMLGGMDTSELANFIAGSALTGDMSKDEVIAIGIAKLAANAPDIIANLPEGNIKNIVLGIRSGNGVKLPDGVTPPERKVETKTAGASGNNLKGYQTIDGETVDFNMIESKEGKAKLRNLMDDLSKRYYNEEIDEETFRKYYEPLYLESRKHVNTGSNSTQQMIDLNKRNHRTEINNALNELQDKAKQGVISPSDYKEQFDNIVANFKKWGLDASNLAKVEKSRISQEKILKNVEKANKKKK